MHPDVAKRARHQRPDLSERILGSAIIENEGTAYVIDLDALYDPVWKLDPEFLAAAIERQHSMTFEMGGLPPADPPTVRIVL